MNEFYQYSVPSKLLDDLYLPSHGRSLGKGRHGHDTKEKTGEKKKNGQVRGAGR